MLLERILESPYLPAAGARVGVAVSGGADSVCLLHVLARLAAGRSWQLHVLHLNHRLRAEESDADEAFVRELAAELLLPAVVERLEAGSLRGNLEEAARVARLGFFAAARVRVPLDFVATGHTASDQAETLLFRLLRGTGPAGLAGVLPVTREGLWRPLLAVTREEIRGWLEREGLGWREDSSNADPRFARNRLRAGLLPLLEEEAPGVVGRLAACAEMARADEEYFQDLVQDKYDRLIRAEAGGRVVEVSALLALHPALRNRLLRRMLLEVRSSLAGIGRLHLEQLLDLAAKPRGEGRLELPGVVAWRSFGWMWVGPRNAAACGFRREIAVPGRYEAGSLVVEVLDDQEVASPSCDTDESLYNVSSVLVDGDRIRFPLCIRSRQPGDGYEPAGSSRRRSLKELLEKARIPSWNRADWPILAQGDQIVWSGRFGVAAGLAAGPGSRRRLRVSAWRVG